MAASRTRRPPRTADLPPPTTGASEKDVLLGFLDYLREGAIGKVEGAPEPAVREAGVPSGTNLLGLIRHLTAVERFRFFNDKIPRWPATHRARHSDTVGSLVAEYRDVHARANEVIATYDDLGDPAPGRRGLSSTSSMRWAMVVVIQETARHAGHLDIIPERIDGQTGR